MAGQKPKKRKTGPAETEQRYNAEDTSKPSAVFKASKGRHHTLSIALPGSIIANALTHDSKTALAGQIARACAVFCVDEIVIFDDGQAHVREPEDGGYTAYADPNFFLYHILSYLETPPNLRKRLFPMHPDLRTAGSLPSLDMPHHLKSDEACLYREGIVVEAGNGGVKGDYSLIDVGLSNTVSIPVALENNTRVTLKMPTHSNESNSIPAEATGPEAPHEEAGYYWGYSVRQASSLSNVFTESPFEGGYDVSIGTSERGVPAASLFEAKSATKVVPTWQHLLIVFGGVAGLEAAFAADGELRAAGVQRASELFDHWVNLVPGQGSRTIRTEEAVLIGLTALRPLIEARDAV